MKRSTTTPTAAPLRNGFTFLEMAIALMLIALISSTAFVSVSNSMDRARVDRGMSRLSFQLQQARSYALAHNRSVYVDLDADTHILTVWIDANRDDVRDDGEEETHVLVPTDSVTLTTSWTSGVFNAYGQFLGTEDSRTVESQKTAFQSGSKSETLVIRGSGTLQRS
jgi:prepilin-type N-terminal cleavage/methylation domain-containing protein